jgi:hypothetical protein
MPQQIKLTAEESQVFSAQSQYWEGFLAGAQAAAEQAKRLILQQILSSRNPDSPPAQPEVADVTTAETA